MAISDTITSIEDNLRADYEGLENIGADLTGINKNILNIRTILDTIYNDLPKVTDTGTEVTITPTRKGRLALIPKGNSIQESTNGYNLLDIENTTLSRENITSVTLKNNGFEAITNSTASTTLYGRIIIDTLSIIDSTKNYVLSCDVTTNKTCNVVIGWYGNSKTLAQGVTANTKTHLSLNVSGITAQYLTFATYESNCTSLFDNIQIEEGSTAHDFEQYTRRNTCTKSKLPFPY